MRRYNDENFLNLYENIFFLSKFMFMNRIYQISNKTKKFAKNILNDEVFGGKITSLKM